MNDAAKPYSDDDQEAIRRSVERRVGSPEEEHYGSDARWLATVDVLRAKLAKIQKVVDEQAKDEGCWFQAQTAPEAYLQQELRRLHAAVER